MGNSLVTGDVANHLVACVAQHALKLGGLLQHVVVVAASHTAVRGDHEDRRDSPTVTLTEHGVVEGARGGEAFHDVLHLVRVRLRRSDASLGLGDLRRSDQLLGLGDLLR